MPTLYALPGIDYWNYRRIRRTLSAEAAAGELLSWERGQERMAGLLDEIGIDYGRGGERAGCRRRGRPLF